MFRFGINRVVSIHSSRSLVTSTTESVQHNSKQSGLKSILAQRFIEHQRKAKEYHTNHGSKVISEVAGDQINGGMRDIKALDTDTPYLNSEEGTPLSGDSSSTTRTDELLQELEKNFARFEERCQRLERVVEKDFVKMFDYLTRRVEKLEKTDNMTDNVKLDLSMLTSILLRCCGKLMCDTPEKIRELLAGNLWTFIKEKKLPKDISHYNSLIRVLNENQTVFDPKKLLEEIASESLTPDRITYQRLIHQYCVQGDINGATNLLEKMKDLGMELNEMTFASLIIGYSKQENPPSTEEMFELMKSNGVEPGNKSISASIISQAKLIPTNAKALDELSSLLDLTEKEDIQFSIHEVVEILTTLSPLKSHEVVEKLIENVCKTPLRSTSSKHRLFRALFSVNEHELVSKMYFSERPSERALASGNVGLYYIRILATTTEVPPEFAIRECEKLKDIKYNLKPFHHLYYFAAEVGNTKVVRASMKKIGEEEEIKCQYLWPLIVQAKDEESLVYVLKNELNPNMNTNDLLDTFSNWVWPSFADNPSRLFELNKQLKYDNNLLMASFLNYSVQGNKTVEAIKFISEAPDDLVGVTETESDASNPPSSVKSFNNLSTRGLLMERLLNQIAEETKDPALVTKAYNLSLIPGQQLSSKNASALVKVHLANNDFDNALEAFLKLAREHKLTPCKKDLMAYCLEKKDPDNLQKIMNVSTEIHGESNSLFDLAVCCLENGKLKQAQKIFNSSGFRVNPMRVYRVSRGFANQGNINALENFVHLTRDMYDISQEHLYQVLIDAYEQTSNGKRALDLWNRMQEEEFQPSKRSLLMIAKVLEKNNIEVPFQKPKMDLR